MKYETVQKLKNVGFPVKEFTLDYLNIEEFQGIIEGEIFHIGDQMLKTPDLKEIIVVCKEHTTEIDIKVQKENVIVTGWPILGGDETMVEAEEVDEALAKLYIALHESQGN